jgi:hypothetical protein
MDVATRFKVRPVELSITYMKRPQNNLVRHTPHTHEGNFVHLKLAREDHSSVNMFIVTLLSRPCIMFNIKYIKKEDWQ